MPTTTPVPTRALLVAVPVVLVAAGIGVAVGVHQHGVAAESRRDTFSAPVREALVLKARDAIEGGATPGTGGNLACAIDLLATDPPSVTDAAAATTAFVWTQCATVGTEVQSEWSIPAAVHFTSPPTAEMPIDGAGNLADKKRIFPRRIWNLVIGDPEGTKLETTMNRRVTEKKAA